MENEQVVNDLPIASPDDTSKIENEKLLTQSEVNSLIGHHKQKAYDKARRDLMEELKANQGAIDQNQLQQNFAQSPPINNAPPAQSNQSLNMQDIDSRIQEGIEREKRRMQDEQLHNAINNSISVMNGKMEAAKSKLPDYDAVVPRQVFNNPSHPYHAVALTANRYDNGAEMLYELAKNPSKLTTLKSLIMDNLNDPTLVYNEFERLSNSIKTNDLASSKPLPPEPLSHAKPTPINAGNGNLSISDYKKIFRR